MTVPKELLSFQTQLERVVSGEVNKTSLHYKGWYERRWVNRKINYIKSEFQPPEEVLEEVKKLIKLTEIK